jgi:hypothetical protein
METQSGQQQAGQQQAAPGGNQQQAAPAQETVPQWLAEHLKDEAKAKEFAKAARAFYDEDFAAHKEAAGKRERELNARLSASDYWKSLDEEGREAVREAKTLRDDAVDTWSDRVPKKLLEKFSTAKAVREFAKEYIEANGGSKPGVPAGAGDDFESRIVGRVLASLKGNTSQNGVTKEPMMPTSQAGMRMPTQMDDKQFIKAFADGENTDTKRAVEIANRMGLRL